jgi:5-methylcytosine-specific restriction protein B
MNGDPIKDVLKKKVIPLLSEYFIGRNDFVKDVFTATNFKVNYNTTTYQWDIE